MIQAAQKDSWLSKNMGCKMDDTVTQANGAQVKSNEVKVITTKIMPTDDSKDVVLATSNPVNSPEPKEEVVTSTLTATGEEVKQEEATTTSTPPQVTTSTTTPPAEESELASASAKEEAPSKDKEPTEKVVHEQIVSGPTSAPTTANITNAETSRTPAPLKAPSQQKVILEPSSTPTNTPGSTTDKELAPPSGNTKTTTNQLKWINSTLLKVLTKHKSAAPFLKPVDPIKLNIPTYFNVIKQPMDFSAIRRKLKEYKYANSQEAVADFELVFKNCYTFNNPNDTVTKMAEEVENFMNQTLKKMPTPETQIVIGKPRQGKQPAKQPATPITTTGTTTVIQTAKIERRTSQASMSGSMPGSVDGDGTRRPSRSIRAPVKEFGWEPSTGHAASVRKATAGDKRLKFCNQVIKELFSKKHETYAWPFYEPVDPVALNLHDYLSVIKNPMDLSTARKNLESGQYNRAEEFISDIRLIFSNCLRYNPPGHDVAFKAQQLSQVFEVFLGKMPAAQPISSASKSASKKRRKVQEEVEEEESSEEDSSEESESSSDESEEEGAEIVGLSKMMQVITSEIARISKKGKGKGKGKKRKPKTTAKKSDKKRRRTSTTKHSAKKKQPAKKQRKEVELDSDDEDDAATLTYEQKKTLSEDIYALPAAQRDKCVDIIRDRERSDDIEGEEIVVDFAKLKPSTLQALSLFVKKCLKKK